MSISSYEEAKEYLEQFIKPTVFRKIELKEAQKHDPLERMRVLLRLLGNPQKKFKSIQVSGTSGKGSTAYFISHILTTAGYKTGLSMSPHLVKVNERIQTSDKQQAIRNKRKENILKPIRDEEFVKLLSSMVQTIELMKKMPEGEPSYFEITMAMSFLYFAWKKVDVAVVEVGIEGKYDASNTLSSLIAVITNIDLDHTDILGETVEEIAWEAVSIIKGCHPELDSGSPEEIPGQARNDSECVRNDTEIVITGVKQKSVIKIIEKQCRKTGAQLFRLGKEFQVNLKKESIHGSVFDFSSEKNSIKTIRLSILGRYQIENAGIAIETVLKLEEFGFKVSEKSIRQALSTAYFPGRFEVVPFSCHPEFISGSTSWEIPKQVRNDNVSFILDGAHNPAKMRSFIASLNKLYPNHRKIFVVAFKENKDIQGMLEQILAVADILIITQFHISTGYSGGMGAKILNIKHQISNKNKKKIPVNYEEDPKKALEEVLKQTCTEMLNQVQHDTECVQHDTDEEKSVIVVTGSLYLVGEVKSSLLVVPPYTL